MRRFGLGQAGFLLSQLGQYSARGDLCFFLVHLRGLVPFFRSFCQYRASVASEPDSYRRECAYTAQTEWFCQARGHFSRLESKVKVKAGTRETVFGQPNRPPEPALLVPPRPSCALYPLFLMASLFSSWWTWFTSLFWTKALDVSVVGLQSSGKTSFVNVLDVGGFTEDVVPTIAFNMRKGSSIQFPPLCARMLTWVHAVRRDNVTLKIWDVAG